MNQVTKLNHLLEFLKENRKYNQQLQLKYFLRATASYHGIECKVIALLHDKLYTQTKPNIDNVALFFKMLNKNIWRLSSFKEFLSVIGCDSGLTYENLFNYLDKQPGWGPKTAALFTKSIYQIHHHEIYKDYRLWYDTPILSLEEKLYLPVDKVIINIFNKIYPSKKWNFVNVNKFLQSIYSNLEIEVFDDLWYWGFINLIGSGSERLLIWNENKYWALSESDKNESVINNIRELSMKFRDIIEHK